MLERCSITSLGRTSHTLVARHGTARHGTARSCGQASWHGTLWGCCFAWLGAWLHVAQLVVGARLRLLQGLGTALGTAHGLGPSLRQGSARMRPLRIVIDAGSSDPVASRQCVFLQTFSRTPSPGASPAHSPCPPRPSAPVPGQVPAMLGFAQFSGRGQEPNREGEDPPLNECLDRLARGPVRRPSVQDHASPRTSPTSSSRPARPLSAGSGNGACSEQVDAVSAECLP